MVFLFQIILKILKIIDDYYIILILKTFEFLY